MRYNSREHLARWKQAKVYPAIHDNLFNFIKRNVKGDSFFDLGCHFGLLTERLDRDPDWCAVGVDNDQEAVFVGQASGIGAELLYLDLKPGQFWRLCEIPIRRELTVLVARRVWPEIWSTWAKHVSADSGSNGEPFANLPGMLYDAGIREMFIEGRKFSRGATHPMNFIDRELEYLAGPSNPFKLKKIEGDLAYLRAE